jgi:hypothetical protein
MFLAKSSPIANGRFSQRYIADSLLAGLHHARDVGASAALPRFSLVEHLATHQHSLTLLDRPGSGLDTEDVLGWRAEPHFACTSAA